jgi:periplasmic mercuric ion binding protein
MKKIKFGFLIPFSFLVFNDSALAQDGGKSQQIQIKTSSVCDMCKKTIEKAMAYEKGIETAVLDVPSQMLTVHFNPSKTSAEKIKKAVTKTGYDADAVPADIRAYNRLDDCCKKDKGVH